MKEKDYSSVFSISYSNLEYLSLFKKNHRFTISEVKKLISIDRRKYSFVQGKSNSTVSVELLSSVKAEQKLSLAISDDGIYTRSFGKSGGKLKKINNQSNEKMYSESDEERKLIERVFFKSKTSNSKKTITFAEIFKIIHPYKPRPTKDELKKRYPSYNDDLIENIYKSNLSKKHFSDDLITYLNDRYEAETDMSHWALKMFTNNIFSIKDRIIDEYYKTLKSNFIFDYCTFDELLNQPEKFKRKFKLFKKDLIEIRNYMIGFIFDFGTRIRWSKKNNSIDTILGIKYEKLEKAIIRNKKNAKRHIKAKVEIDILLAYFEKSIPKINFILKNF